MRHNGHHASEEDYPIIKRLGSFRVEASLDGLHLYSMTAPVDERPVFLKANRLQVTAAAQELNIAAFVMAQRSGTAVPAIIPQEFYLRPDIQKSIHRYDPRTRTFLITWHLSHKQPMPHVKSLEDYLYETSICDALAGINR